MKKDLMTGLNYHITQEEISRRHKLIRNFMKQHQLGVVLILVPYMEGYRRWISGEDGTERRTESCFLIPETGEIFHIIGNRLMGEDQKAEQEAGAMPDPKEAFEGIRTIYYFSAFEIRRMLEKSSGKKIGLIHGQEMRADLWDYLEKNLPEITRLDMTEEFGRIRAVKSDEEQYLIRRAVFLQERVLDGAVGYIKPGMLEKEAVRYLRYLANHLESGGIDSMEYAQIELMSWRDRQSRDPLFYPGRYLEEGDLIQIRLRIMGDSGYYGTITRCFSLGKPEEQAKKSWNQVLAIQNRISDRLKPGISVQQIQNELRDFAEEQKICLCSEHFIHGIGYCVSEVPDCFYSESVPLERGMVVVSEPEIMDKQGNRFCCGDVWLITESGAEKLTKMSQEIQML